MYLRILVRIRIFVRYLPSLQRHLVHIVQSFLSLCCPSFRSVLGHLALAIVVAARFAPFFPHQPVEGRRVQYSLSLSRASLL